MKDDKKKEILDKVKEDIKNAIEEAGDFVLKIDEADNIGQDLEAVDEDGYKVLPLIPLRGICIFPGMVLHFDIGREKSIQALEKAMIRNQKIFLATQKDENTDLPTIDDFYHVGTVAKVKQMLRLPGDTIRVLVEGISRGKIKDMVLEVPYFKCSVIPVEDEEVDVDSIASKTSALMRSAIEHFDTYISLNPKKERDVFLGISSIDQPGRLADLITSHLPIKTEEKQEILQIFGIDERLEKVNQLLRREIEILNIAKDIDSKIKSAVSKNQKEYYLREQMKVIQDELGMGIDVEDESEEWLKKLDKLKLPQKTDEKVRKEIGRYKRMSPSSAESSVSSTYIETILALPWNKATKVNADIKKAETILNEDHYGLEKVKERILEYISVMHLTKAIKGPILCLVGPPGVGKTSIAKSIARATNRKFVRMSLGGVRDEAEIRGHRRTYVGAIPGRIIASMKEAESNNPVFLLDEVDKIGADFKGDPASALLEVLDPEQNRDFVDHYLETPFDLSKVMFITTANSTDTIPRPLLDRMEVIQVQGYTEEEKVKIAQRYLIPKKIGEHGLKTENVSITEPALHDLINYYTRESGVRNLEREIANLCRKVAKKVVAGKGKNFKITGKTLEGYLGKKKYRYDMVEGQCEVGVTTGMAWTAVGGDTLFIETTCVAGTGKLELTGKLGEVMKESAKAGISYIRSVADKLGIEEDFYKTKDIHIHVPEGAVPKDGPSAGVTMCTALISTLTNTPVRKDVAMTGEISLRGNVLPVGGIREKVLAAHRAGAKKILLPYDNERDIDEIPASVRKKLEFVLLRTVDDALRESLVKAEK